MTYMIKHNQFNVARKNIKSINVGIYVGMYVYLCHSYIPTYIRPFIFAYEYMNLVFHMPLHIFGFFLQIKYKDFEIRFLNSRSWDFFWHRTFMDGGEGQIDVTSQFTIWIFSILMLYIKQLQDLDSMILITTYKYTTQWLWF
jgi:hypothetical protein